MSTEKCGSLNFFAVSLPSDRAPCLVEEVGSSHECIFEQKRKGANGNEHHDCEEFLTHFVLAFFLFFFLSSTMRLARALLLSHIS